MATAVAIPNAGGRPFQPALAEDITMAYLRGAAGECPERQRELTVNQPPHGFAGSSPASPTSLRSLRELRRGGSPEPTRAANCGSASRGNHDSVYAATAAGMPHITAAS